MTITLQIWMFLLALGQFFYPNSNTLEITVESEKKSEEMKIRAQKSGKKWSVSIVEEKKNSHTSIAQFFIEGSMMNWSMKLGSRGLDKAVNLKSQIEKFETLDWKSAKDIKFTSGDTYAITRTDESIHFRSEAGASYTLRSQSRSSTVTVSPGQAQTSTISHASLQGPEEATTGGMVGWTLFKKPLVLFRGETLPNEIIHSNDPSAVLVSFFKSWMSGDPKIAGYFSPKMDTDALKLFHSQWRELGRQIKKVTIYGFVRAGGSPNMKTTVQSTFKTFLNLFGPHERVYFTEINSEKNDCFVIFDKIDDSYRVLFVASQWAASLVPAKYKRTP